MLGSSQKFPEIFPELPEKKVAKKRSIHNKIFWEPWESSGKFLGKFDLEKISKKNNILTLYF
jgi:hypothetical protein